MANAEGGRDSRRADEAAGGERHPRPAELRRAEKMAAETDQLPAARPPPGRPEDHHPLAGRPVAGGLDQAPTRQVRPAEPDWRGGISAACSSPSTCSWNAKSPSRHSRDDSRNIRKSSSGFWPTRRKWRHSITATSSTSSMSTATQDQFYMVMEYVQGVDLQHQVEQTGPLAIDVAARILGQAAAGLAHAHQRGVLHRDLQPTNLILDEQGNVKIVGWGIGRLAASRRTLAAAEAGQPEPAERSAYAAPEEAADHDGGDAQSDIYSLGSIAYYSLTGQASPAGPVRHGAVQFARCGYRRYRRTASRCSGRAGSRDPDDDGPRYPGSLRLGCGGGTRRAVLDRGGGGRGRVPRDARERSERSGLFRLDAGGHAAQPEIAVGCGSEAWGDRRPTGAAVPVGSLCGSRPAQYRVLRRIILLVDEAAGSRSLGADPKRPAGLGVAGANSRPRSRRRKTA